jgi:cysteine desulfurase/selenocysteine lyase
MKNFETLNKEFPIFQLIEKGKPFSYLDNAATTQKPYCVINTINKFYEQYNSNVHRGIYTISQKATEAYENTREIVADFIGASNAHEVVFTSGTTESINLIASSFTALSIKAGDEILISTMEHHSNIVPWQLACKRLGAILKVIPITEKGELSTDWPSYLSKKTKLLAITHASNVLGTINPIKKIITIAHQKQIPVLVDGAQAIAHLPVDVSDLNCDFYAFSAHKMYGPTGVGILYAKEKWLNAMPPYQSGGEMIINVTFEKTLFANIPYKFEAGTPNIAGVIGLGSAIKFLKTLGFSEIERHEKSLLRYTLDKLSTIPDLQVLGSPASRIGVIAFTINGIHPHDIASILDTDNVAVRAGHHCAQPLHQRFGLAATTRVSLGVYNTKTHIDRLVEGLLQVKRIFKQK